MRITTTKQCPKCACPMKKVYTDKRIILICTNIKCLYIYKLLKPKEKQNG